MKDIDDEKGITFRPKLNNDYNKKIIKNYDSVNNEEYINKKNNKIFDYLSNKDKECTFHPKINNISNTNELNVSERLFGYQNKYKQKLELMRSKYCNFTFKPKISENTNIILNKRKLIHHLKEEIKNNCSESNLKLLLNEKDEKDNNLIEESKNEENHENNENKLSKFNVNNKKNIKNNENEMITPVIVNKIDNYSRNKEKNNLDNKYHRNNNNNNFHLNDFKVFINNIKNKDNNKKKNKKIMDFDYYNNIV